MTNIVWEDPQQTPRAPRTSKHDEFAAALRRRPGKWAVFAEATSNSTASAINKGKLTAFRPAGAYEATGRTVEGGFKVWVRYVGSRTSNKQHLAQVRDWARSAGWAVNDRGRIPQQILDAYQAAHNE